MKKLLYCMLLGALPLASIRGEEFKFQDNRKWLDSAPKLLGFWELKSVIPKYKKGDDSRVVKFHFDFMDDGTYIKELKRLEEKGHSTENKSSGSFFVGKEYLQTKGQNKLPQSDITVNTRGYYRYELRDGLLYIQMKSIPDRVLVLSKQGQKSKPSTKDTYNTHPQQTSSHKEQKNKQK